MWVLVDVYIKKKINLASLYSEFKKHPWRQSIVKTVDSIYDSIVILYRSGRAQHMGLAMELCV